MNTAPKTYAIRVDGHLDDHWSAWLGELDMTRNDDGTTTITTLIADQAQLHGVFAGLRDIGAVITELRATVRPSQPRNLRNLDLSVAMTDGRSVLQIRDSNRVIHTPTTDSEARKDQGAGLRSASDQGLRCAASWRAARSANRRRDRGSRLSPSPRTRGVSACVTGGSSPGEIGETHPKQ